MALKLLSENPQTTDTIRFIIKTPGSDGCFTANPYKVDNVTIFSVKRGYTGDNFGQYDTTIYNEALLAKVQVATKLACDQPTDVNVANAQKLRDELASTAQHGVVYYNDANVVLKIGSSTEPAWMDPEEDDEWEQDKYPLINISTDENGDDQFGHFYYDWNPGGKVRAGDFFLCVTWTPNPAGSSIAATTEFYLAGNAMSVVTTPTHITPEGKYETLLERYLPEMYKQYISDDDITPEVLDKLNKAIAQGFIDLENLANQIIDLFDANAVHESLLVYLANLFNLRLKSNDPQLWRRQIKEAVPLFKMKGTMAGLQAAFAQAGMRLNKLTRYWQVVSHYTWQDSFKVADSPVFTLSHNIITPINEDHFELWLRRDGETETTRISNDCVEFGTEDCNLKSTMTWVGDDRSANPIQLYEGDYLRVLYQYKAIPSSQESVEDFVRSLPYGDLRDEAAQDYPPKNWNVRLVEEDDPMFNVVIPARHPFHDPVIFGQIRTEFPYSENIFNMEEWNGSTRDSSDPCHIDKSFIEPCGSCLSSKFSVDIGIEELTDDRISEARDVLREFMPFNAQPHAINFEGEVNEIIASPVEKIEMLINFLYTDYVLSGNANPFFTRNSRHGLPNWDVLRDQLADAATVVPEDEDAEPTGTAFNDQIRLYAPHFNVLQSGVIPANNVLKVLAPSANYGEYTLGDFQPNSAEIITSVDEPLDTSMFTFDLYNKIYNTTGASIIQDDIFSFLEDGVDFTALGVKTQWDVLNEEAYDGSAWTLNLSAYDSYQVLNILPDGSLLLYDPDRSLPVANTSSLTWTLLDGSTEMASGTDGELEVSRRGRVDFDDLSIVDLELYARENDMLVYDGEEYLILNNDGQVFYIDEYAEGDAIDVPVSVRRPLVSGAIGYFQYSGLKLLTTTDYEDELGILNGQNPPMVDPTDDSHFFENYLIVIDDDYYRIADIDSTTITLDGTPQNWTTSNAGGTMVNFSIIHATKAVADINFVVFDQLGREGKDPIIREIYDVSEETTEVEALSVQQNNIQQEEGFSITIEYRDGRIEQGVL